MLKYVESAVTFAEFPDEVALAINLSNCPNHCPGCSEAYLAGDIGEELTCDKLDELIQKNVGITLVGFMGGDNDHEAVRNLANFVHDKYKLKVGIYSGRDFIDLSLAQVLDYYKVGGWRMPEGDSSTWSKKSCGPLSFTFTNQKMYKREDNLLVDITDRFRINTVNNLERAIIK